VVLLFVVVVVFWFTVLSVFVYTAVGVAVEDVCSVGKTGSIAGEEISACANHVWGEGKLLAVEDEEVSLNIAAFLAPSALSLESFNSVLLVRDLIVVLLDTMIVVVDSMVVLTDT